MKEFGLQAVVLEPGPAMLYLTGVRWGKSERTFAVVLPAKGDPVWVLPGFEEMRARELIHVGDDIRVWQEDESPYQRIVDGLKERGVHCRQSRHRRRGAVFRLRRDPQAGAQAGVCGRAASAQIGRRRESLNDARINFSGKRSPFTPPILSTWLDWAKLQATTS